MPTPFHQYASAPIEVDATTVHRRLTADLDERISAATATALSTLGTQSTRWGFTASALPITTDRITGADELGAAEVSWDGDQAETGWPAMTGRLVVTPQPGACSRLVLFSRRSPRVELAPGRLDRLHGERIVHVAIKRFLRDLAHQLDDDTSNVAAGGAGARAFDREPMFLHHLQDLDVDVDAAHDWLLDGFDDLAERATEVAVSDANDVLEAGRFRAPARPRVEAWRARPDEPATVWIRWVSDEEASGWPQLDLALLVEARGEHARLSVLSLREPGYDLSRSRVDKQQRHQILQQAGRNLTVALAAQLPPLPVSRTADRRQLATTT